MTSRAPQPPKLDGRSFDLGKTLGRGAFGEVFVVQLPEAGSRRFALKRTPLGRLSEEAAARALAEARLLQSLGEENECILRCFDSRIVPGASNSGPGVLELLLELAPLGDLSCRIRAQRQKLVAGECSGLPEAEATGYGCDMAAGLAHIHALRPKVLHRDVKPANVVLFPGRENGTRCSIPRAKLADFGIARILESDASFAGAATVIGTPQYFAPEICRGDAYDERSDAWALGCVLYEMLCLHRPFHQAEGNLALLAVRISDGKYDREALADRARAYNGLLVLTLVQLLSLDPQQRYRCANALEALKKLRDELPAVSQGSEAAAGWWLEAECSLVSADPSGAESDSWQDAKSLHADTIRRSEDELEQALLAAVATESGSVRSTEKLPTKHEPAEASTLLEAPETGLVNSATLLAPVMPRRLSAEDTEQVLEPMTPREEEPSSAATSAEPSTKSSSTAFLKSVDTAFRVSLPRPGESEVIETEYLSTEGASQKEALRGHAAASRLAWADGGNLSVPWTAEAPTVEPTASPAAKQPQSDSCSPETRPEARRAQMPNPYNTRLFLRPLAKSIGRSGLEAASPGTVILRFVSEPSALATSPAAKPCAPSAAQAADDAKDESPVDPEDWLEVDLSTPEPRTCVAAEDAPKVTAPSSNDEDGIFSLTSLE
eukprot:gnl/TRDRNA2_/TRDRNA2_171190_c2_seq3.p1 gnl/TRDRNA2_/TRDRNA2_171190_c2~~gnl/TRDRNA2_/TRDRNA2_171190_c2_seq3.p1  ORF type:complete len:664 (+),score=120.78 gnl/TRDRNA2_/TRDRNA2_171190_c2_seq3:60-2051(+)